MLDLTLGRVRALFRLGAAERLARRRKRLADRIKDRTLDALFAALVSCLLHDVQSLSSLEII